MSKKSQLRLSVDTMRFHCVVINNNRKAEKRRCLLFVVCVSALFERVKKRARSASPSLIG